MIASKFRGPFKIYASRCNIITFYQYSRYQYHDSWFVIVIMNLGIIHYEDNLNYAKILQHYLGRGGRCTLYNVHSAISIM